jgi:hypothetical protein
LTAQANVVPDASMILKWAFKAPKEDHTEQALILLNEWVEIILASAASHPNSTAIKVLA